MATRRLFAFPDELKARAFEHYLKSGSGRRKQSNQSNAPNQRMQLGYRTTGKTFAKRHFI